MHGHVDPAEFLFAISGFLGTYYIVLAILNAGAALYLWQSGRACVCLRMPVPVPMLGRSLTTAHLWLAVAMGFTFASAVAFMGERLMWLVSFPQAIRDGVDAMMNPVVYTLGSLCGLTVLFLLRKWVVKPAVAWGLLNLSLAAMGFSMTDPDFAAIVTKPDNVPIVGMVFLLGYFTWLATYKAVQNDDRISQGLPPLEKLDDEKVLVWPDLVYTELICMIAITALLLFWGIGLQAPLEEPASAVKTPNPSKAPWYFLGLQEMLVYYDPWMAGVVLPSLVIFGLMAIPYLDFNKKGNGYYTIAERPFAYLNFQFGFLVLWVTLIVMGTFLRGPNWNFFGVYETWDAHKVEALNNIDLSERFWVQLLNTARPRAPEGAGKLVEVGYIVLREMPGIVLLGAYLVVVPPALVIYSRYFRTMFVKLGLIRYMVLTNLLLMMALLPIKMLSRWTVNMKYFISIPEYFLNF